MPAEMKDLMTFDFRTMKFEPCTHDRQKADDAKAFYWKTLSEEPQVQEIVKAFNDLKSAKYNRPKLIDGSTYEEVGVDVLKKKNILLIISGFSNDDILKLKSIYEGATSENSKDNYKLVWIPIVEKIRAWTDDAWNMLRTEKPWYVLPCSSSRDASGSQFMIMSKKWQFKNEFIMMVMDLKGKDKDRNAFRLIITPTMEMNAASASTNPRSSEGPKKKNYVFYFRGTDDKWNNTFERRANRVGQDVLIKQLGISVKSFRVSSEMEIKEANQRLKDGNDRPIFSKDTRGSFFVLGEKDKVLLSGPGDKILDVLKRFHEQWKKEVEKKGFRRSFLDSYENSA